MTQPKRHQHNGKDLIRFSRQSIDSPATPLFMPCCAPCSRQACGRLLVPERQVGPWQRSPSCYTMAACCCRAPPHQLCVSGGSCSWPPRGLTWISNNPAPAAWHLQRPIHPTSRDHRVLIPFCRIQPHVPLQTPELPAGRPAALSLHRAEPPGYARTAQRQRRLLDSIGFRRKETRVDGP